jgi:catechol 2,3-dioxygenase-like lactoylglutathione lyase family enzyme
VSQPDVRGIDNVGICVSDLRRALEFYEHLGFHQLSENDRGVTIAMGAAKLFLFESRVSQPSARRELGLFANPPGIDHITFLADDVDALHAELTNRRIQTGGPPADQDWGARAFGVCDPDGNILYFLRWL